MSVHEYRKPGYKSGCEYYNPCTGEVLLGAQVVLTDSAIFVHSEQDAPLFAVSAARCEDIEGEETAKIVERAKRERDWKRGEIAGFTSASRKRMHAVASQWVPMGFIAFLTLTYGRNWPPAEEVLKHRNRFLRALREVGLYAGLWRLEYQTRGAPHFHFVLDGFASEHQIIEFRKWVEDTWQWATGSPVRLITQCDPANDQKAAKFYLGKELGKTIQAPGAWAVRAEIDHKGRFWGVVNRARMKYQYTEVVLPNSMAHELARLIQNDVLKNMIKQKKVRQGKDGFYFTSGKGNKRCNVDYLQKWMLFKNPFDALAHYWGKLSWDVYCRQYEWDAVPSLRHFVRSGDADTLLELFLKPMNRP